MDVISHAAPTDWISPPKLEARLATQTAKKIRYRKGDNEDARLPDPSASFAGMEHSM
jgi:hypothetical protein